MKPCQKFIFGRAEKGVYNEEVYGNTFNTHYDRLFFAVRLSVR